MRSAVLAGPEKIIIEKRPRPEPTTGEALVEVAYVAICGSDQERYWHQIDDSPKPMVFGHEFSGRLVSVRPSVKGLTLGQPVTVAPLFNCEICDYCRSGKENLCQERSRFGFDVDGALQDIISVPYNRVFPLPDGIPIIEGALVEPMAVAYHAARLADFERQGNAVVIGAGAIGLLIAQIWQTLGNSKIRVVDIDPARLSIANELDIPTWTSSPKDANIDILFEASGSSSAFSTWISALAPGGRAIIVGKLGGYIHLDWVNLLRKEVEILTSRYFTLQDFQQSLILLKNRQVILNPLIGKTVPFESLAVQRGKLVMEQAKQVVRFVIQM